MKKFMGKRYLIYGDGISGRAAARAIRRNGGSVKYYSDENGKFCVPNDNFDCCVVAPSIKLNHDIYSFCKEKNIPTTSEIEIGFSLCSRPIIGVTGTNGKTTVTRLIAAMIGGVACGNIGVPLCSVVDKANKYVVCELSSFQLSKSDIKPSVAVITNIDSDHIDWHGSEQEYQKAKLNIAKNLDCNDVLVLGEDIKTKSLHGLSTNANIIPCYSKGVIDGCYVDRGFFCYFGERVCRTDYLRLQGEHNVKNALCAIAVAKSLGVDNRDIIKGLSTATLDEHRIQSVGRACGKAWINDSKGTNVSASVAAIKTVDSGDSVCLIVGGRDKRTDFRSLFEQLPNSVIEVVAMGECANKIINAAKACDYDGTIITADGLRAAVEYAKNGNAKTVLLSPCCASFDEFKNYSERGKAFCKLVNKLRRRNEKR